ncbi:MAG: DMT family transporter [Firmicutes bacterium]|nr:DMT family transporter [Bacillota bacterium]
MSKELKGIIMLFVTAFIWGTAFTAQSAGMEYIGPFTFNCVRSFLGGLVLIPIMAGFKAFDRQNIKTDISLKNTVIGGICCGTVLFAASALQQCGIAQTTAGKAGFITALYIVLVPLAEYFIYKKASKRIWLCVLIAMCGFYLLCIKEDLGIGRGDMLVLVCAFCFTVHIMVIDVFNGRNTDGMLMSCIQFFTAGVYSAVFMLAKENVSAAAVARAWLPLAYAGIMSSGVAYTLQILGQRRTSPAKATLIMSLESVFAAAAGAIILGEKMQPREMLGCVLVFAAVIIAQIRPTSAEK